VTEPKDSEELRALKAEEVRPAITAVERAFSEVTDLAARMADKGFPDEDVSRIIELVHALRIAGLALRSYAEE